MKTSTMSVLASHPAAWPREIRYVALCGNPKSGKSTIAEMMEEEFGGVLVDDGLILRQAVPILFGIPKDEPFTHEGKAKVYDVCGRQESVRQMLGELGNWLEDRYSPDFMPIRGMAIGHEHFPDAPFYLFASCRKTQGRCYRSKGGVVIQVDNPTRNPSGNAFDEWDRDCVDLKLNNDPANMDFDALRHLVRDLPNRLRMR